MTNRLRLSSYTRVADRLDGLAAGVLWQTLFQEAPPVCESVFDLEMALVEKVSAALFPVDELTTWEMLHWEGNRLVNLPVFIRGLAIPWDMWHAHDLNLYEQAVAGVLERSVEGSISPHWAAETGTQPPAVTVSTRLVDWLARREPPFNALGDLVRLSAPLETCAGAEMMNNPFLSLPSWYEYGEIIGAMEEWWSWNQADMLELSRYWTACRPITERIIPFADWCNNQPDAAAVHRRVFNLFEEAEQCVFA